MNKKILIFTVVAIIIILIIAGIVYKNLKTKPRKEQEISMNNNAINQGNSNTENTVGNTIETNNNNANNGNAKFNFETKTVKLNSGYEMPLNGIGTYSLTGNTCYDAITSALNSGVRLIDTAYMYSNEEEIGKAIKDSNVPREEIFIITKLYPNQFDKPEEAIKMAFEKLDIDYIDMMLLHHPGTNDVKAYKAIEKYVEQGKIRSVGLSNWYVKELEEFLPQINIMPSLVQNEIHPYYQENDVIPYLQNKGIVVQGWYPFGGRGHTKELLNDSTIVEIANNHNVTSATSYFKMEFTERCCCNTWI